MQSVSSLNRKMSKIKHPSKPFIEYRKKGTEQWRFHSSLPNEEELEKTLNTLIKLSDNLEYEYREGEYNDR